MRRKLLDTISHLAQRWRIWRLHKRIDQLKSIGMRIGHDVNLPPTTWIDVSHCFLISIGDHTGFGPECLILAHDAQMDEYLDAARVGRVTIHESCHIGARCIILPGVEIGPRTVVGAGSIIARSLPPNSVCAGNPAKVICSLDEYIDKHRDRIATSSRIFPYDPYGLPNLPENAKQEMIRALQAGDGYITGGRSAELRGEGDTPRTK